MKKMNCFVLLLLLTAVQVRSQSFPTISNNPGWKVGVWNFWFGNCEAYHWKYGNALTICGRQYTEAIECDHAATNCQVRGYIRVDQDRVYTRKTNACTEHEKLMYDFSLQPGAFYYMGYNSDSTRAQVTGTQSLSYQGINRITQAVTYTVDPPSNNYTDHMQTIQGIGSEIHPFFPLVCFGDFCETNMQLLEYSEHNVVMFTRAPVFPMACNGWVGLNENGEGLHVNISPNPASGLITLESSYNTGAIKLVDCIGKLILEKEMRQPREYIDLSELAKGIYFIELYSYDHLKILTKKVIKN